MNRAFFYWAGNIGTREQRLIQGNSVNNLIQNEPRLFELGGKNMYERLNHD